jgi:hypothetical protein
MLLFFAAQFVMVECAAEIGMIDMIGGWLESIIRAAPAQQRTLVAVQILLWASAVISGILVSSSRSCVDCSEAQYSSRWCTCCDVRSSNCARLQLVKKHVGLIAVKLALRCSASSSSPVACSELT